MPASQGLWVLRPRPLRLLSPALGEPGGAQGGAEAGPVLLVAADMAP